MELQQAVSFLLGEAIGVKNLILPKLNLAFTINWICDGTIILSIQRILPSHKACKLYIKEAVYYAGIYGGHILPGLYVYNRVLSLQAKQI